MNVVSRRRSSNKKQTYRKYSGRCLWLNMHIHFVGEILNNIHLLNRQQTIIYNIINIMVAVINVKANVRNVGI